MADEQKAYEFWLRVDEVNNKPLNLLCKEVGVNYNTVRSNRASMRLPSLMDAHRIAMGLGTTVEYLLDGDTETSVTPDYGTRLIDKIRTEDPILFKMIIKEFGLDSGLYGIPEEKDQESNIS